MRGQAEVSSSGWLGPKIREARLRRGLSQAELARAAGVSASFVRLLEAGKSDVSLSRLLKLTGALGLSVAEVVSDGYSPTVRVSRVDDRVELPAREAGIRLLLLFAGGESAIEPAIFQLDPAASMQKSLFHRGREFVYVLDGRVRLELGSVSVDLDRGEAADYQSTIPHRFSNLSDDRPASFLIADAG
jgi:transcriptional regulator with XRE-family HTH domain